MNKREFLSKLEKSLKVNDKEDIIQEYEEHFRFKLADGFSEEEIAAKLGNPDLLAKQFNADIKDSGKSVGTKIMTGIGFAFADLFVAMLFILLFGWVAVMAAASIGILTLAVCLAGHITLSVIPQMPYLCALIYAVAFTALSVLSAAGTVYFYSFSVQLLRAYLRFHKNVFSALSGGPVYPSLALHPRLSDKTRRRLRAVALISLTVFIVGFIAGFIVSAVQAGSMGFWHVWNWFVR